MNYKKNYYDYINYIKTLNRVKGDGNYYEKHHIIPRSLGGNDAKDNLVLLTAREHFLAHYLLWKFNPCKETAFAFHGMCFMKNNYQHRTYTMISSKVYQKLRIQCANYNKEYHHSEETKQKISENNKGKHHMSEEHKNKLRMINTERHPSEETRHKMSISRKGRIFTDEHKLNLSKAAKKRIITEEEKKKMSETRKRLHIVTRGSTGMHWYNNGIIQLSAFECPEGFIKGRLPYSENTKINMSKSHKGQKSYKPIGTHWYNNGIISVHKKECPEGFVLGRLSLKKINN